LKRLTIDWILIQGILRLFAIYLTVREGVGALKQDPDITRRLGRRAVEPLIDALDDPDREVRDKAALVLGELGDRQATLPLTALLHGPDAEVRWRAAAALGELRDSRAVGPLVQALRDPDEAVRSGAVRALEMTGDGTAVEPLLEVVRGSDPGPVR